MTLSMLSLGQSFKMFDVHAKLVLAGVMNIPSFLNFSMHSLIKPARQVAMGRQSSRYWTAVLIGGQQPNPAPGLRINLIPLLTSSVELRKSDAKNKAMRVCLDHEPDASSQRMQLAQVCPSGYQSTDGRRPSHMPQHATFGKLRGRTI
jgi:hypothetical protein